MPRFSTVPIDRRRHHICKAPTWMKGALDSYKTCLRSDMTWNCEKQLTQKLVQHGSRYLGAGAFKRVYGEGDGFEGCALKYMQPGGSTESLREEVYAWENQIPARARRFFLPIHQIDEDYYWMTTPRVCTQCETVPSGDDCTHCEEMTCELEGRAHEIGGCKEGVCMRSYQLCQSDWKGTDYVKRLRDRKRAELKKAIEDEGCEINDLFAGMAGRMHSHDENWGVYPDGEPVVIDYNIGVDCRSQIVHPEVRSAEQFLAEKRNVPERLREEFEQAREFEMPSPGLGVEGGVIEQVYGGPLPPSVPRPPPVNATTTRDTIDKIISMHADQFDNVVRGTDDLSLLRAVQARLWHEPAGARRAGVVRDRIEQIKDEHHVSPNLEGGAFDPTLFFRGEFAGGAMLGNRSGFERFREGIETMTDCGHLAEILRHARLSGGWLEREEILTQRMAALKCPGWD